MEINFSSEDLQSAATHTDLDWSQLEDTTNANASGSGAATVGGNVTNGADWELIHKDNESQQHSQSPNKNQYSEEETLLYNQETRQKLTNELEEVEFFLRQRLNELT